MTIYPASSGTAGLAGTRGRDILVETGLSCGRELRDGLVGSTGDDWLCRGVCGQGRLQEQRGSSVVIESRRMIKSSMLIRHLILPPIGRELLFVC